MQHVTFLPNVPQEAIELCRTVTGVHPAQITTALFPPEVVQAVELMQWTGTRDFRQVLIRPQDCRQGTAQRTGTFWHRDIDVHARVAPTWEDMILTVASFGEVAVTEFIEGTGLIGAPVPALECYTDKEAQYVNSRDWPITHTLDRQLVRYRSKDWHRAGPIVRTGWRLVIIGIESDHLEPLGAV